MLIFIYMCSYAVVILGATNRAVRRDIMIIYRLTVAIVFMLNALYSF